MSAGCGMCANGTVPICWHLSQHKPFASLVCSAVHQAAQWLPAEDGSVLERIGVARAVNVLTLCNKVESCRLWLQSTLCLRRVCRALSACAGDGAALQIHAGQARGSPCCNRTSAKRTCAAPAVTRGRFLAGQCYAGAAESVHLPTARRCL